MQATAQLARPERCCVRASASALLHLLNRLGRAAGGGLVGRDAGADGKAEALAVGGRESLARLQGVHRAAAHVAKAYAHGHAHSHRHRAHEGERGGGGIDRGAHAIHDSGGGCGAPEVPRGAAHGEAPSRESRGRRVELAVVVRGDAPDVGAQGGVEHVAHVAAHDGSAHAHRTHRHADGLAHGLAHRHTHAHGHAHVHPPVVGDRHLHAPAAAHVVAVHHVHVAHGLLLVHAIVRRRVGLDLLQRLVVVRGALLGPKQPAEETATAAGRLLLRPGGVASVALAVAGHLVVAAVVEVVARDEVEVLHGHELHAAHRHGLHAAHVHGHGVHGHRVV
mmetsp:Transcript_59398/g.145885  ORF Transcript_59398/g.145885 Transcript_59398/m.145885 type:complete len:335 (+) Transcript_59398:194-1198(+)